MSGRCLRRRVATPPRLSPPLLKIYGFDAAGLHNLFGVLLRLCDRPWVPQNLGVQLGREPLVVSREMKTLERVLFLSSVNYASLVAGEVEA
jgi:hypothetical protein